MWKLSRRQHGMVTRRQLLQLGFSKRAIEHRLARGRLHEFDRGVYAVGRPESSTRARWKSETTGRPVNDGDDQYRLEGAKKAPLCRAFLE